MGCSQNLVCGHRLYLLAIFFLFLLISSSSQLRIFSAAEGRKLVQRIDNSQTISEEKAARIGSRPPRCERRCSSCAQCEAIQVPTNPQTRNGIRNSIAASTIHYARSDDNSNYKPMSWKCKCGSLIFNPDSAMYHRVNAIYSKLLAHNKSGSGTVKVLTRLVLSEK